MLISTGVDGDGDGLGEAESWLFSIPQDPTESRERSEARAVTANAELCPTDIDAPSHEFAAAGRPRDHSRPLSLSLDAARDCTVDDGREGARECVVDDG